MRTVIIILIGLVALAVFALVGRQVAGSTAGGKAALMFIPLWVICAGINMYFGVARAGYSVADEAPIFLVIAAIPAAAALFVRYKLFS